MLNDILKRILVSFCIISLILLPWMSLGQTEQSPPKFHKLTTRDELPNNAVLAITQDQNGFMWFGTPNGLCRYDGARLRRFVKSPQDTTSISSNQILTLFPDQKGKLWIGTENGISLFNPQKANFQRFLYFSESPGAKQSKSPRNLYYNAATSLFKDSDSLLWVGTSKGLFRMTQGKKIGFKKILDAVTGPRATEEYYFRGLCQDKAGFIWVASGKWLFKLTKDGRQQAKFDYGKFIGLAGDFIHTMAIDHSQNLWIGGSRGSVTRFNQKDHSFEKINYALDISKTHVSEIWQITMDGSKGLWIVGQHGITYYNLKTGPQHHYRNNPADDNSLDDNHVLSTFRGSDGTTWFGTLTNGISYLLPHENHFRTIKAGEGNALSYPVITSVTRNKKAELLIGTAGGGVNLLNQKNNNISSYSNLKNDVVSSVLSDRHGDLWVAINGLKRYDAATNTWHYYQHNTLDTTSISANTIYKLFEDKEGNVWLSTTHGLDLFDRQRNKFKRVKLWNKSSSALTIFEDSKSNLWIGTCRRVVYKIPKARNKAIAIPFETMPGIDTLESRCIWTIHEDRSGNIWAGGFSAGLKKFNPEKNIFANYDCPGLYDRSNTVMNIESDKQGRLWLGMMTNDLIMVDLTKNRAVHFGKEDGIPGKEFSINGSYQDENGILYFGTSNGLLHFDPNKIRLNTAISKLVFTSLEVNDKPISVGDSSKILTNEIQYSNKIILKNDQNFLKIGFALLNYIHPKKNSFEYRLGNGDPNWHRTTDPWVTFNNLAPGEYKLWIRGYNNDNFLTNKTAEINITVLPPWYQTWWAYMIYALILLSIFGTIIRLFWIKASYGQALELNQYKLDFFTNISHEIRTNLALIIAPLDKIEQNMNLKENVKLAQNNANKLLQLVTELMDFRKLESAELALHVEEHDIVATVTSQVSNFKHVADQKELTIAISSVREKIMVYFDAYQMGKAVSNLISNALKFVDRHGYIEILIGENDKTVSIKIIDDGKGIAPEHISKIFENYFQVYEYGDKNTGYGIGLPLSKGIVTLHHGTITAQTLTDADGKISRTCFEITLPKGSAHFTPSQLESVQGAIHKPTIPHPETGNLDNSVIQEGEVETILIAEDNDELRKFIASCFPQYRIIEAPNGQSALEETLESIPDLVITDVMMPGMSGTEFCKKIKQDERTCHIPVVMLTAMVSDEQIIAGLESQADHYITKPFNTKELELKVINLLNLRNSVRERVRNAKSLVEVEQTLPNTRDKEFINKLATTVENNISKPDFGVDELALEIGIGRTVLYKKLKAATGMSVNDFIKMLRLNYAAKLLREESHNVNEVAELVGFNDRRYFTKEFARIIGKTPSAYAKEFKTTI